MKLKFITLLMTLFVAQIAVATEATPEQLAALKPKFNAQDCALWRGGEDHQNDNVSISLVDKVQVILGILGNLPLPDALKTIEKHCDSGAAK